MKNITEFLKECRVNGNEKIDTNDDSFWKLKDLLEHYKEQCNIPVVRVRLLEDKLNITEKALNDIVRWDEDFEQMYGCAKEKASRTLEHLAKIDGF